MTKQSKFIALGAISTFIIAAAVISQNPSAKATAENWALKAAVSIESLTGLQLIDIEGMESTAAGNPTSVEIEESILQSMTPGSIYSIVNQDGDTNSANIEQDASLGGSAIANVEQIGRNNEVNILQQNGYNYADVLQNGTGNNADIEQLRGHNYADVTQMGTNNQVTIKQSGQ